MDALYHFVLSAAGGYLLAEGLRLKYKSWYIPVLSILSMIPDLQHLAVYVGIMGEIEFHGLYMVMIPLAAYVLFYYLKPAWKWREYLFILSLMLFGHMVMDTVSGTNGVPLFYPLSDKDYLMPHSWNIYVFNDVEKPIASTYGIGIAIYFGAIGLIVYLHRFLSSKAFLRKTSTRK